MATIEKRNSSYQTEYFVNGFDIKSVSETLIRVYPGALRAQNSDSTLVKSGSLPDAGYIEVDTTTVGVGGCYPSALINPSFIPDAYYVAVIGDSMGANPISAILYCKDSYDDKEIKLPDGYDLYAFIGRILFNSSGDILPAQKAGKYLDVSYMYADEVVLSIGSSTSFSTILSSPKYSASYNDRVAIAYEFTVGNAGDHFEVVPVLANTGSRAPYRVKSQAVGQVVKGVMYVPSSNDSLYMLKYRVSNAASSVKISVVGNDICLPLTNISE